MTKQTCEWILDLEFVNQNNCRSEPGCLVCKFNTNNECTNLNVCCLKHNEYYA